MCTILFSILIYLFIVNISQIISFLLLYDSTQFKKIKNKHGVHIFKSIIGSSMKFVILNLKTKMCETGSD